MASEGVRERLGAARTLVHAGILRPLPPLTFARSVAAMRYWGRGIAGAVASNAAKNPSGICLIDDLGPVTHGQLNESSSALAHGLAAHGVRAGDAVGLLCRDSRFFAQATVAVAKLGADLLLLNTAFSGPQLHDVITRERARAVIYDEEFEALLAKSPADVIRVVAWQDVPDPTGTSIDGLIASAPAGDPPAPAQLGRTVLLTSGTTGTPKGARRPPETPAKTVIAVLDRIPVTRRDRHFVVAPMFHAWGFAHFGLGLLLGAEIVMRRRFDAEQTIATIARQRVTSTAMVPVMAQRILALPQEVRARYDTTTLRLVALGGSAIPGDLAIRFMDAYGDIVYNAYGSSEVAIVSIAGPEDLRADHATAGRPIDGIAVKLLDGTNAEVAAGAPGRIFVGSEAAFEGYTSGETKPIHEGLMATGDVGSFDGGGRLRIEGRDDDMIVSGGENVYPREVEDVISSLPGIAEAAVIGVPDDQFGQRLKAHVVLADGAALSEDAIKEAVRAQLARYKIPREVVFHDELPRTSTGKILKRELH